MDKNIANSSDAAGALPLESDSSNGVQGFTRRSLLTAMALAPLATIVPRVMAQTAKTEPILSLVSRHVQWATWQEGLEVAIEAGYPGIFWTVRAGAHVLPENVARDLPRIVEATRAAGLEVPLIITNVGGADTPHVERMLDVFSSLGISRYRAGPGSYNLSTDYSTQADEVRRRLDALQSLNEKYGMTACFHTQSGPNSIGGALWDLWTLMKDLDPRYIAINFDVGHIVARNGNGWMAAVHAAGDHIQSLTVKDVRSWLPREVTRSGQWAWDRKFVPPGEGMVDWPSVFDVLKRREYAGPIGVYHEYMAQIPGSDRLINMLGTSYGEWELEVPRDYFVSLLKRDVDFYKAALRTAGLTT